MPGYGDYPVGTTWSRDDVGAFATWCNAGVNNKYFNSSMVDIYGKHPNSNGLYTTGVSRLSSVVYRPSPSFVYNA